MKPARPASDPSRAKALRAPVPPLSGPLCRDRFALPLNDAARMIGVSRATIYRLISAGLITPRKIGSRTVFIVTELEEFVHSLPTSNISTDAGDPTQPGLNCRGGSKMNVL